MTSDEAIQRAIQIMGEGQPDDYVIAPTHHAQQYRDKAPGLAAVLSSGELMAVAGRYENEDRDAGAAQNRFRAVFRRANATALATAILISLVLVVGTLATSLPDALDKVLFIALAVGSVIVGGLASKDLFIIKQGRLLEDWMSKRAFAETTRLGYFDAVTKSSTSASDAAPMSLLKLEYFRRFQLDVQRAFYRKRGSEHREEAAKTLSCSAWAVAGAGIATGLAGVLGFVNPSLAAIAALGTVFAGLSTFAAMREAVFQDRRNAERYGRTFQVLDELHKRLKDVREAVHKAGDKPLADFVEAVHEQLSLEHRQWLGDLKEARGAFARLETTLKELSSQVPPKPGDAAKG